MRQRFRHFRIAGVLPALAIATIGFTIAPRDSASAAVRYTFQRLHSFSCTGYCTSYTGPVVSGLLRDSSGNLYGTTRYSGTHDCSGVGGGCGIVFELIPNQDFTRYSVHVIRDFNAPANGYMPTGELIMDVDGNLYGTTYYGGAENGGGGVIYKLTKGSIRWTETVLHAFCSCGDGTFPVWGLAYQGQESGALWDGKEPLFGVTDLGGVGNGNVFEATPGATWTVQNIHTFKQSQYPNPVVVDASGNVYGTNQQGGTYGEGLMYTLAAGTWKETTLKNFCAEANCTDGSLPTGRLVVDAGGNIFGTTYEGGSGNITYGGGVVFERPAGGSYQVLYNFCSVIAGSVCTDGQNPGAGVITDGSGDLFGTTGFGGKYNDGLVFELDPRGAETVIYNFGGKEGLNGAYPGTPLLLDSQGDLFGTTESGGTNGFGIAFVLKP